MATARRCCARRAGPARRATEYRRAIALTHDEAERRLFERRLADLDSR